MLSQSWLSTLRPDNRKIPGVMQTKISKAVGDISDHGKKGKHFMSVEQNKANNRRVFEEAFNQGKLAVIDEVCAPNYVLYDPTGPVHTPEGFKQFISVYRTAFPDLHFTIEDEIAEGDKVVMRWTSRGTHRGELMGIPPTGKQSTVTGITIARAAANGKFEEVWNNLDTLGMLQQLGVIPTMG
jgi:steroid delta-isomerase-like uncharacterized protein